MRDAAETNSYRPAFANMNDCSPSRFRFTLSRLIRYSPDSGSTAPSAAGAWFPISIPRDCFRCLTISLRSSWRRLSGIRRFGVRPFGLSAARVANLLEAALYGFNLSVNCGWWKQLTAHQRNPRSAPLPLRRYLRGLSPSLSSDHGTLDNQNLNDKLVPLEQLDRRPARDGEKRSPPD